MTLKKLEIVIENRIKNIFRSELFELYCSVEISIDLRSADVDVANKATAKANAINVCNKNVNLAV